MPGDEVIGDSFQQFLFEVWRWLPHMPRHCVNTLRGIVKCRANATTTAIIAVLVINNTLLVIGFDKMTLKNMRTVTIKRGRTRKHHQPKKRLQGLHTLRSFQYRAESFDEKYSYERFQPMNS
ncbi:hypothetical protein AVEN_70798-1 [Araneus ventricosus]|uniref:Uncharacterized protein n=1 Tax=Araneus ventricosus TaxID=182803 RepID=A0A4Y2R0U5_ARAVE|nr:hypothetical protein AVEN_70798-1 [Araneus ventricosus]